jgi:malate dehydrogenase (quinone)
MKHQQDITPQILLIGGGIMSATLGVLLKELDPNLHIIIVEQQAEFATESSDAWNNAGTGHNAYCEFNYTPQLSNGSIDSSKALKIASQFEVTKSFWYYLLHSKKIPAADNFWQQVPHFSIAFGTEEIEFLRKRFETLSAHFLFDKMQYTEDEAQLKNWLPLIMSQRNNTEKIAVTKMEGGLDIDFGKLTKQLFSYLQSQPLVDVYLQHEVRNLDKDDNNKWYIEAKNLVTNETVSYTTPFVFIGAGGGSLPLLEKANIPEGKGYGGFPVSGQWLVCNKESIIKQHHAKVYGKAKNGAPPMSVPHLDSRFIDGKQALLFGPFAGFSTKFLKAGSYFDLPASVEFSNLFPLLSAGWHNIPLTKYLVQQVLQSPEDRIKALQEFVKNATLSDWDLAIAGQRVQVIKKDEADGGKLEFGTELITAADGSLAALLGASPGASTAVSVMLDVIKKCFPTKITNADWQNKLIEMIPSFGKTLASEKELFQQIHLRNNTILGIV